MRKSFWIVMLIAVLLCPVFAGGASETAAEETGVVTLRISHNMDFTTIPEAFVDAAARLNERYAAEGRDLRIEFEKDYQTMTGSSIRMQSHSLTRSTMLQTSTQSWIHPLS